MPDSVSPPSTPILFSFIRLLLFLSVAKKITRAKGDRIRRSVFAFEKWIRRELAPTWYCTSSPEGGGERSDYWCQNSARFSIRWRKKKKKSLSSCICPATPRTREPFSLSTAFRGGRESEGGTAREEGGKGTRQRAWCWRRFIIVLCGCPAAGLGCWQLLRKASHWAAGGTRRRVLAWNSRRSAQNSRSDVKMFHFSAPEWC